MNGLLLELLGSFGGVVGSHLALPVILAACVALRRPWLLRSVAAAIGAGVASIEGEPGLLAAAGALGGAAGGLVIAEAWLAIVLPLLQLAWRAVLMAAGLALDCWRLLAAIGRGDSPRDRD